MSAATYLSDLKLGEEPQIGVNYMVPCLDMTQVQMNDVVDKRIRLNKHFLNAIPIIGTVHKDPEFPSPGGQFNHIHIDLRFITEFEYTYIWEHDIALIDSPYGSFPILPLEYMLDVPKPHFHEKMCFRKMVDASLRWIGTYSEYQTFEDEMEKHPIKPNNPICSHHGTNLKSQCVHDGKVTCPLHGLVWDTTTGKLVRKTPRRSVEEIKAREQLASLK